MKKRCLQVLASCASVLGAIVFAELLSGCSGKKVAAVSAVQPTRVTVFSSGEDNVNSYRIPSLVTAADGSLLVFCEARRESWRDKSRTDVVMKRSTDNGVTWSAMADLTHGTTGAFMDPTPVIDTQTGKIFLFTSFWPTNDHSGRSTRAMLLISTDHGATWSDPVDVSDQLVSNGGYVCGFGPGSGLCMQGKKYKGRIVVPVRMAGAADAPVCNFAIYSDDHGQTWHHGAAGDTDDEFQIAESPYDHLVYNSRKPGARMVARSDDGGDTWTPTVCEVSLPAVSKGCQASVLGRDRTLYFSGIRGGVETPDYDERANLALYKSTDGGNSWNEGVLLYEKGAGYSCMSMMKDGRMAIAFEAAETPGFTRRSIAGTQPPKRPAGWMRIDLITLTP